MDQVLQAVLRTESKIDVVAHDLGELKTDHAVLQEKFAAHNAIEVERAKKRWQVVLAIIGAVAAAWAPTVIHAIGK